MAENRQTPEVEETINDQAELEEQEIIIEASDDDAKVSQDGNDVKFEPKAKEKKKSKKHARTYSHEEMDAIAGELLQVQKQRDEFLDLAQRQKAEFDNFRKRTNKEKVDLINEGYDLAIRATPALDDSTLICKRLTSYPTYTVISKKYIERYGKPHHPRELSNHHCICYSNLKKADKWDFIDKNGSEFTVPVKERIRSNNGHMELAMALDGHGIVRLPEFFLAEALQNDDIEVLFTDFPTTEVHVYAVYPSRKHLSPKVRKFVELLQEKLT